MNQKDRNSFYHLSQRFFGYFSLFLSALACYAGETDIAIYLAVTAIFWLLSAAKGEK